jgi:DNA polymerase III delta subunit
MSYRAFLDECRKGLPLPGYMLVSSDRFLQSESVTKIKNLVPDSERDFNFHVFDVAMAANEAVPFQQIIDVLQTVPFFSGKKCLQEYAKHPAESSVLVLMHFGSVKKGFKDLLKNIKPFTLDLRESEIPFWIKQRAQSRNFTLSRSAVEHLLGTIGTDLGMLASEVDKCVLIGKPTVERQDIIDIVEGKRSFNVFDLVNAIRTSNTDKAFRVYSVLRETEEPYSLLGALNWHYGQLLSARNSPRETKQLYDIFNILNQADLHIKSSGSFYPIELLLIKLLRLSKTPR